MKRSHACACAWGAGVLLILLALAAATILPAPHLARATGADDTDTIAEQALACEEPVFDQAHPVTYDIILQGNGGTTADGSEQIVLEALEDGTTYQLPNTPFSRDGYTFVGWSHTQELPEGREPLANEAWFDGSSAAEFGGTGMYWAQWTPNGEVGIVRTLVDLLPSSFAKHSSIARWLTKVVTAGTNVNVKYVREIDYGFEAWTNERNVIVGNQQGKCFCVNNGLHGPHYDYTAATEELPSTASIDGARACLWYGYGGPGESAGNSFWPSRNFGGSAISAADKIGYTHIILNYFVRGELPKSDSNSPYKGMTTAEMNWCKANLTSGENTTAKKMLAAKDSVSPQFKVFLIKRAQSDYQDLVGWASAGFGQLTLTKKSADPSVTDGNPQYELAGARYSVYESDGTTGTHTFIETDATGKGYLYKWGSSSRTMLEAGTYKVVEYQAPPGFAIDPRTYTVTVSKGGTANVTSTEPLSSGTLSLSKSPSLPEIVVDNPSYTLEGARYGVYTDSSCESLEGTLVTRADGTTEELGLAPGTYYVKELEASPGYLLDPEIHEVTVETGILNTLDLTETPGMGGLKVSKTDAAGNALNGAVFDITNVSEHPVVVGGESYGTGAVCARITSGTDGIATTGQRALPYGSYRVSEHAAPRGYAVNDAWSVTTDITEDGRIVDLTGSACTDQDVTIAVALSATKQFDGASQGRSLEAGMFSFTLSDERGTVLQTKTNDAQGHIIFDSLVFSFGDIGTHHYAITEVTGTDEEIVYDAHRETVSITIAADTDNSLTSTVSTDSDGVVFRNTTVAAVSMPHTGERGIGGGIVGSALALVAGRTLKRRKLTRRRRR